MSNNSAGTSQASMHWNQNVQAKLNGNTENIYDQDTLKDISAALKNTNIPILCYPIGYHSDPKYQNRMMRFIAVSKDSFVVTDDAAKGKGADMISSMLSKMRDAANSLIPKQDGGSSNQSASDAKTGQTTQGQDDFSFLDNFKSTIMEDIKDKVKNVFDEATKLEARANIFLPLPNSLNDSQGHAWESTQGPLASMTSGLNQFDQIKRAVAQVTNSRQMALDPDYWQNYKGSSPRTFNMSFDFTPENKEEAQVILDIVLAFKKYSSPSLIQRYVGVLSPFYWKVEIGNEYISAMINMDCVVMTNVELNYSGNGEMDIFYDGFPKHMILTLTMAETRMKYDENYTDRHEESYGPDVSSTGTEGSKQNEGGKVLDQNERKQPEGANRTQGDMRNNTPKPNGNVPSNVSIPAQPAVNK